MGEDDNRTAGAAIWRSAGGTGDNAGPGPDIEVLLVHRTKEKKEEEAGRATDKGRKGKQGAKEDWSLPKGKIYKKKKETWPGARSAIHTAVREVREETCVDVRLGQCLGTGDYRTYNSPSSARYWAATVVRRHDFRAADDGEVDEIRWFSSADAKEMVASVADQRIIEELEKSTRPTRPFIFLRNANAPGTDKKDPKDHAVPLDEKGLNQAKALSCLLGCYGALPVVTSDAYRCTQTVAPYVARYGVDQIPREKMYRDKFKAGSEAAFLMSEFRREGPGVIVCGHHQELPELALRLLGPRAGAFDASLKLEQAEFAVFHVDDNFTPVARETIRPRWTRKEPLALPQFPD